MSRRHVTLFLLALAILPIGTSCDGNTPGPATSETRAVAGGDDAHETSAPRGEAREEEEEEGGTPALDRSLEELTALTCEHGKKTFECDDCRFQIGFVRAPASLRADSQGGGLLQMGKAARQKVAVPVALTGEVGFDERRVGHVSSQVEGIIKKVHVALGEKVTKGQALIELESVAVGEAQAAYLEAQGLLELARRSFDRASGLRREKISSEKEFLQAKQELDAAQIRADSALGKLARLGTGPAETASGSSPGRILLRAPIDGAVLVMHAVPGEVAKTDESLLTVGDNTVVWVWADLYERDIASVQRAQAAGQLSASVSVRAYRGELFSGTVDLVSPAMDESSRTVKMRVEVDNHDGRLLAGMFAAVEVFLPGEDETLAVPRDAVLEDEGSSFVFVPYGDEYYVQRRVVPGRTWAGMVEIRSGLEPGQAVVAEGSFLLKSDVLRSKMGAGCAD